MPAADGNARTAAAEDIADAMTRRTILGMRYDAQLARDIFRMLKDLERDLVAQIAAIDATGPGRAAARRARLETLLREARAASRKAYRRIRLQTERDLDKLTEIEAKAARKVMAGALSQTTIDIRPRLPLESTYVALSDERLVLGQPLADWWERADQATVDAFSREMRIGVQAGETVEQLARRISGGTRDGVQMRGVMDVSRSTARTLVRTSVASVQNAARQAVYEANGDVITEFVHLSRLDDRTSDVCIARAGLRWDAKTRKPIGHDLPYRAPPLHPNCRSVLVVRVIGGEPPPVGSAKEWIGAMDAAEQDAVLGRGKAALYRAGKITTRELIDQSDRPVPLKALKAE